jgi:hypothetical protein
MKDHSTRLQFLRDPASVNTRCYVLKTFPKLPKDFILPIFRNIEDSNAQGEKLVDLLFSRAFDTGRRAIDLAFNTTPWNDAQGRRDIDRVRQELDVLQPAYYQDGKYYCRYDRDPEKTSVTGVYIPKIIVTVCETIVPEKLLKQIESSVPVMPKMMAVMMLHSLILDENLAEVSMDDLLTILELHQSLPQNLPQNLPQDLPQNLHQNLHQDPHQNSRQREEGFHRRQTEIHQDSVEIESIFSRIMMQIDMIDILEEAARANFRAENGGRGDGGQ